MAVGVEEEVVPSRAPHRDPPKHVGLAPEVCREQQYHLGKNAAWVRPHGIPHGWNLQGGVLPAVLP